MQLPPPPPPPPPTSFSLSQTFSFAMGSLAGNLCRRLCAIHMYSTIGLKFFHRLQAELRLSTPSTVATQLSVADRMTGASQKPKDVDVTLGHTKKGVFMSRSN